MTVRKPLVFLDNALVGELPDGDTVPGAGTPITGEVRMFALATLPVGWLKCDGSWVDKSAYPELFAVIAPLLTLDRMSRFQFELPNVAPADGLITYAIYAAG